MRQDQLDEFFQIVDDVIKYGSLEERFPKEFQQELQNAFQEKNENTDEPTAEQREEFYKKLNRPYGL
jgi:polyhydroxyalkanoate synthesis regulator phasin